MLYAATADADQIVSACLDTGTMPALSLAFECAEISSELAIGLRRRLDQVRDEVYEHKGDPEQRRLIAAVLAASLARETIATSSGTRICRHPVNADLYWAFLEDSQSPQPDNPCEPGLGRLATGIRESEALAFVKWLNALNTDTIQGEFRLPHEYELNEHAVADALARQLPGAVTGAWTQPRQQATTAELWIPPGRPNPHLISGDTIQQVIFSDTGNTEILRQILAATASTSAYELYQSLSQARDLALNLAEIKARHLSRDLSATTNAIAREFASAKAHDLTDALGRDLNRAQQILRLRDQARALTDDLNTALYFDRAKDRDRVRELARYISLKGEIVNGLALDRRLANAIDLDLARLRDLDRDFARVRASDHFRDRTLGLGRTDRLARDLGLDCTIILANDLHRGLRFILARARSHARDLAHELGRDLGLDVDVDPRVSLLAISEIPLAWISRGAFGRISQKILLAGSFSEARHTFADDLSAGAGIERATQIRVSLDDHLISALEGIGQSLSPDSRAVAGWGPATGAKYLAKALSPLLSRRDHSHGPQAAVIRAVALALASQCTGSRDDSALHVFQEVAATVTLLQLREQGKAEIGESVVLTLA